VGAVSEAYDTAGRLVRSHPKDLELHELYIDLMSSMGLAGRAARIYAERRDKEPLLADAHYLFGRATPDAANAQKAYEQALRIDPDHARSYMGMAALHVAAGRSGRALEGYERAASLDPSLSEAWLGWVRGLSAVDPQGARAVAKRARSAVPGEPGVYLVLATLAPDEAVEVLEAGRTAVPDDARIPSMLAMIHLEAGKIGDAAVATEAALALDVQQPMARKVALFVREFQASWLDSDGCKTVYGRTLRPPSIDGWMALESRYPKSALVRMGHARALQASGGAAEAASILADAVALDPENVEARAALGLLLLERGDGASAANHLRAAVSGHPWDGSLGLALSRALMSSGSVQEGGRALADMTAQFPMDVRVARMRAQWLLDHGAPEEAYLFVRDALQRLPDGQLGVALIAAALATGRTAEAASFIEAIGRETGNPSLVEAAERLRGAGQASAVTLGGAQGGSGGGS
jgi:tetratricopeptide (TPR) repeat protein